MLVGYVIRGVLQVVAWVFAALLEELVPPPPVPELEGVVGGAIPPIVKIFFVTLPEPLP